MAVDIKDVKVWAVSGGISHVVAEQLVAGTFTACNVLMVGDWRRRTRTRRVCTKCRDRLREAALIGDRR